MTATADESTLQSVAERLRFFLSDANLRHDAFLRKIMLSTEGPYPGQVKGEVLLRFNTIKQYTKDVDVVMAAARTVDYLQVSEDGKAIGRKDPFTKEKMDEDLSISFMVENIPADETDYKVSMDDVRELFAKFGRVMIVKFRFNFPSKKHGDDPSNNGSESKKRVPAGSALVEFETEADLQRAAEEVLTYRDGAEIEAKQTLELGGNKLKVMLLKEWVEQRRKKDTGDDSRKRTASDDKGAAADDEPVTIDWKPGCVIRLEGLSKTDCDREAIFAAIQSGLGIDDVKVKEMMIYVDYSRGQEHGAIRFQEPSDDVKSLCEQLNSGNVKIKDSAPNGCRILEGEEEEKYWAEFIAFKAKQMKQRAEERSNRYHKKRRHK